MLYRMAVWNVYMGPLFAFRIACAVITTTIYRTKQKFCHFSDLLKFYLFPTIFKLYIDILYITVSYV